MKNEKYHVCNNKSGGFTLIELVVAILIFALGIVGIMKMHQASVQSNMFSMQLTQAMNISTDRIEFLRGLPFDNANMSVGATHGPVTITSMGVPYAVSYTVAVTPNSNNYGRTVNLTIAWDEKAIHHQLSIPAILSQ
jgi:prepilin-type N-terminal cleavage/methylation domain-containing protein